jgi:RNA polymerase sigma-70 factor (ECF subfamily)
MGEREFDDFYAAYFRRLTVQICAYVGNLAEAQDVVQEAFCRAWPRWQAIAAYDDPYAWVRRVAWNVATSRWRRVRTATAFAATERAEVEPELSADRVDITRALAHLPAAQRKAVVMHHLAGMSVAEIAQECRVPEGTVRSWLHRARTALADRLEAYREVSREHE